MAIIKTFRNALNVASIFEDPQPGSDYIYFQNDAYSKSSLSPIYDKGLNYSVTGLVTDAFNFGWSNPYAQEPSIAVATYFSGRLGGILQLAGETTHIRHHKYSYGIVSGTSSADGSGTLQNVASANNLDLSPFISLDTTYKVAPNKYFTDGNNNAVIAWYHYATPNVAGSYYAKRAIYTGYIIKAGTSPSDLASSNFFNKSQYAQQDSGLASWGTDVSGTGVYGGVHGFPLYRNPSTGNLVWQTTYFWSDGTGNYYNRPGAMIGTAWTSPLTASPTRQTATNNGQGIDPFNSLVFGGQSNAGTTQNSTGHFLGVSSRDSQSISVHIPTPLDHAAYFYKYNDLQNSTTLINYYNWVPLPAGLGGTGAAGTGTYLISNSMTVANTLTYITGTLTGNNGTWYGRIEGNVMTVTSGTTGVGVVPGQVISGTGITAGTTVLAYTTSSLYTHTGAFASGVYATPRMPSKTFTDTSAVTNIGFYIPRFDSTGTYQPLYYIWNKNTDFITRYPDVYITYPPNTNFTTYWAHDSYGPHLYDNAQILMRVNFNETFVSSTGTRHLILGKLHGAGSLYDSTPLQRSFIVYTVDPTNYKKLSFHQSLIIPSTPKNICWLNDDRTLLAVVTHNVTFTYYFNPYTGFQLTGTFPYQYNAIGRDALGRVWAQDAGPGGYGRIHLLSGVPATITVTANTSTYNYSGTAIPTTFALDAFDLTGSRMTATVVLSVAGSSLKLLTTSSSNTYLTSLTTTTNMSTSTTIYGTVISNGYSSITTTLTI
jgi:hypothetical protein